MRVMFLGAPAVRRAQPAGSERRRPGDGDFPTARRWLFLLRIGRGHEAHQGFAAEVTNQKGEGHTQGMSTNV